MDVVYPFAQLIITGKLSIHDSLHELVTDQKTGLLFEDANMLTDQLFTLFGGKDRKLIDTMRQNVIKQFEHDRWHDNWTRNVIPIL